MFATPASIRGRLLPLLHFTVYRAAPVPPSFVYFRFTAPLKLKGRRGNPAGPGAVVGGAGGVREGHSPPPKALRTE